MSLDKVLMRRMLQIDEPWEVQEYKVDLRNRRCEVWVGVEVPKTWFGRPKKQIEATISTWRHVNFGNLQVYLHVAIPNGADVSKQNWTGDAGLPFTRALAKQVFSMFNEGVTLRGICALLDLPLNDLWRYRFALDNGKVRVGDTPDELVGDGVKAKPIASTPAAVAVAEEAPGSAGVPDLADPVWTKLAMGEFNLDVRVLSLKLMLTRVRSQLDVISDDEVRMLKLRELHRYFVKNERMLGHELAQLRAA